MKASSSRHQRRLTPTPRARDSLGMRHFFIALALAISSTGCILSTEFCGEGFVEDDGRCVPADPAPPYYTDALPDQGAEDAAPDQALEPAPPPPPEPEPMPEPPEPEPFDPWADRFAVLVVDRTDRGEARGTPGSPGYDLDAVLLIDSDGELVGFASEWIEAQINDPFGRNLSQDPNGGLGEPDAQGVNRPERYVSLGAEGGFVLYFLEAWAPLRRGMRLLAFDMPQDRGDERIEIYLCLDESLDLARCLSAGELRGTGDLLLE